MSLLTSSTVENSGYKVYTAMKKGYQGVMRDFEVVSQWTPSQPVSGEIFPNKFFGLNARHFLVATLAVSSFEQSVFVVQGISICYISVFVVQGIWICYISFLRPKWGQITCKRKKDMFGRRHGTPFPWTVLQLLGQEPVTRKCLLISTFLHSTIHGFKIRLGTDNNVSFFLRSMNFPLLIISYFSTLLLIIKNAPLIYSLNGMFLLKLI